MKRVAVLLLLAALTSGCYRTVYTNLAPPVSERTGPPPRGPVEAKPKTWHHFFFWGVDPPEVVIDAAATCGGPAYVERLETEQNAIQALMELVVGYYVNIYSPWTGRVVCKAEPAAVAK